jgi:hypothetical protein
MNDTRTLLAKITALRQRLEQAQGLANEARSAAAALLDGVGAPALDRAVATADEHDQALDEAVRPLVGAQTLEGRSPSLLTSRARRVLEHGRDLLGHLRQLAEAFPPDRPGPAAPLALLYRDTVAMIDTALRTVALLPDSATAQMHLCKGLEVTLEEVAVRLRALTTGWQRLRHEDGQVARLAAQLSALDAGESADPAALRALAEEVLAEARECAPLGFLEGDPQQPAHFAACQGLTVARVVARVIRHDPELRSRPVDAVLAALLHDAGMLGVSADVLSYPDVVEGEERRLIEAHAVVGAQQVAGLFPDAPWLAEAVGGHHERLDGTGYPDGMKGNRIRPLTRLLAVCDVYAALCVARPHRPARATRTALADTLLLAEQGQLDQHYAECLLSLSFYPVGSVVELAHGAVGVVVATPGPRADLNSMARPVVALLTDGQGEPLSRPHHIDLGETDRHSIVRSLTATERQELLARRFPHWAA